MKLSEVTELLNCSPTTVKRLVDEGSILRTRKSNDEILSWDYDENSVQKYKSLTDEIDEIKNIRLNHDLDKIVIKRDGKRNKFNLYKIEYAIYRAFKEAKNTKKLDTKAKYIFKNIAYDVYLQSNHLSSISEIQSKVEGLLIENGYFDVAKAYTRYRLDHDIKRSKNKDLSGNYRKLFDQNEFLNNKTYNENANKDSDVISTKRVLQYETTTKMLMRDFVLKQEWKDAHDEGWIYIHDLADLFLKTFNCNLFDLGNLMKNKEHEDGFYAFKLNNKITYEPKHISTAFDLMSSVTIQASSQQFGGFTISEVDKILAPHAEKSYQFYLNEADQYEIKDKDKYAFDKTLREIKQGIQSYTFELAQTQNALGQCPFTTISFGLDTSKWGKIITEEIIKDRMRPDNFDVFPKLVFLSRAEINRNEDSPNYDLYKLSLECSKTKLYPDYLSLDFDGEDEHYRRDAYNNSKVAISPMGCRAHLSRYLNENGEDIVNGRFNIGAVTINFVKIAIESKGDTKIFNKLVKKYANMIFDILNWRYSQVGELKGSSNPLFWCEGGAFERISPNQYVKDSNLLAGATASIGYVGLYEAINAFIGNKWKDLLEKDRLKYQKNWLNLINKIREQRSIQDNHPYALYGTPAESLVYTFNKMLTKQYGIIEGVTDREYITNSFHIPVWKHLSSIDKINFEKDFHEISKGGHISYCEFNYGTSTSSLEAIVNYAMSQGMYFGINVVNSTCNKCGNRGDFLEECDVCESKDILVIQRVCGYLSVAKRNGEQSVNDGKWEEIKERTKHGIDDNFGGLSHKEKHNEL